MYISKIKQTLIVTTITYIFIIPIFTPFIINVVINSYLALLWPVYLAACLVYFMLACICNTMPLERVGAR